MKKYIALLLAVLLLSGCATQRQESPASGQEQPGQTEQGPVDQVSLAVEEGAGFDPYNCQSSCNRLILELVLQPLFTVSDQGEALPVLAKGWSVSEDGKTTTVYLKDGVCFHDGKALTAQFVVESIRRAQEGAYYQGRFHYLQEVSAPDPSTVVLQTEKAYECLPLLLDIPVAAGTGDYPMGTGPYEFSGESLRQSSAWQGTYPCRAKVIPFVPVADAAALRDSFQYGGISAAWLDPNAPNALTYGGNHALWSVPTTILQYVGFNLKSGPFSSGGLRSAVTYAVDRTAIVREDMSGAGAAAPLAAIPGSAAQSAELAARVVYEPEKFRQAAAGFSGEAVMIVSVPGSQRAVTARRIARSLTECGLKTTVKALSPKDFRAALEKGDFDLYYAEVRLSPNGDLTPLFSQADYGGLRSYGDLRTMCDLALANSGNAYDLQKTILVDGLLCPVAFKHTEVHIYGDAFSGISPKLGGWIFT